MCVSYRWNVTCVSWLGSLVWLFCFFSGFCTVVFSEVWLPWELELPLLSHLLLLWSPALHSAPFSTLLCGRANFQASTCIFALQPNPFFFSAPSALSSSMRSRLSTSTSSLHQPWISLSLFPRVSTFPSVRRGAGQPPHSSAFSSSSPQVNPSALWASPATPPLPADSRPAPHSDLLCQTHPSLICPVWGPANNFQLLLISIIPINYLDGSTIQQQNTKK